MKISVVGTGYVGLVTGVCFAEMGNDVFAVDVDQKKIDNLKKGISPIFEPGLDDLIASNIKNQRIQFSTDLSKAVKESEILFIAVGTPSDVDGSADLKYVLQVAREIGEHLEDYRVIVNKSTVPVGTAKLVRAEIESALSRRKKVVAFDVVSNPEFLREGVALEDCLKPSRVVIGTDSPKAEKLMRRLYEPFLKSGNPLLVMDPASSEMTKYAANAMLATRISLMNEFSRVCEGVGADIEMVRRGIGTDPRIGTQFIFAGVGYGGSCFPKDVRALIFAGNRIDEDLQILKSVEATNIKQRERFSTKISKMMGVPLNQAKIALWGVAFKPGTDDIREAPAIDLIETWLGAGAKISAFDPVAAENAKDHFAQMKTSGALSFYEDQYECLKDADALVIATEWKSFREPNFEKMKSLMKNAKIFDGRNLYDPAHMSEQKISYYSIGRGTRGF